MLGAPPRALTARHQILGAINVESCKLSPPLVAPLRLRLFRLAWPSADPVRGHGNGNDAIYPVPDFSAARASAAREERGIFCA